MFFEFVMWALYNAVLCGVVLALWYFTKPKSDD